MHRCCCCTGAGAALVLLVLCRTDSSFPWLGSGTEGPEVTQLGPCSDTRALSPVPGAAPIPGQVCPVLGVAGGDTKRFWQTRVTENSGI